MGDALLVGGSDGIGQSDGDVQEVIKRKAFLGDALAERLPLDELHGEEVEAVGFLYGVDGDDVGMVEGRHRLGFPLEPHEPLGACRHLGR